MKKKMKKGKRELIIEIGREQILYSYVKKYFNLKEAVIYCVSESGKQLKIDLWSECYE